MRRSRQFCESVLHIYNDFIQFYNDFLQFYNDFLQIYNDFLQIYNDFLLEQRFQSKPLRNLLFVKRKIS